MPYTKKSNITDTINIVNIIENSWLRIHDTHAKEYAYSNLHQEIYSSQSNISLARQISFMSDLMPFKLIYATLGIWDKYEAISET